MERGAPPTRTASEAFVSDSPCIMQVSYYINFTRLSLTTSFLYRLGPNPLENHLRLWQSTTAAKKA